ncbi:MAG: serine hydrolase [Candidatus Heimdallarchaeota archaeon]
MLNTKWVDLLEMNIDDSNVIKLLEEKIQLLLEKNKIIGLSITLINDAKVIWEKGFGYKDREECTKVTPETLFEAASLSKPTVAFLTLKASEEGKLNLDTPMIDYLSKPYLENQPLQ